jgi:PhnB protein
MENAMNLSAHVSYNGRCEEAFKYYEKHLGGKILRMMTHAGTPAEGHVPAEWKQKIMHGQIQIDDSILMGVDAPPGRYQPAAGYSVSLNVTTGADAERIYAALSDNGTVQMPMQETFFAVRFGMTVDQFGIPWIVICEKQL